MQQVDDGRWFAEMRLGYLTSFSRAFPVWADTLPHAICLAALAALSPADDGGAR